MFDNLVNTMKILRKECPWDKEQTISSLKPYLLEEVYEVLEAMDEGGENLKKELGDLLLQIVFQSVIKEEENEFNVYDVVNALNEKLIRRHPHVFSDKKFNTTEEVNQEWEKIKKTEKEHEDRKSALDGIPKTMPSILKAYEIQKKAAKVGFDWDTEKGALEKIEEEILELKEEYKLKDMKKMEEELGDLIFALINFSRKMKINPEFALQSTINKFERRFRFIEDNIDINNSSLEEMDKFWDKAKEEEKKSENR